MVMQPPSLLRPATPTGFSSITNAHHYPNLAAAAGYAAKQDPMRQIKPTTTTTSSAGTTTVISSVPRPQQVRTTASTAATKPAAQQNVVQMPHVPQFRPPSFLDPDGKLPQPESTECTPNHSPRPAGWGNEDVVGPPSATKQQHQSSYHDRFPAPIRSSVQQPPPSLQTSYQPHAAAEQSQGPKTSMPVSYGGKAQQQHWTTAAATTAKAGPPSGPFPVGSFVEYKSRSSGKYILARVEGFDESSGYYRLDVQPHADPSRVRARDSSRGGDGGRSGPQQHQPPAPPVLVSGTDGGGASEPPNGSFSKPKSPIIQSSSTGLPPTHHQPATGRPPTAAEITAAVQAASATAPGLSPHTVPAAGGANCPGTTVLKEMLDPQSPRNPFSREAEAWRQQKKLGGGYNSDVSRESQLEQENLMLRGQVATLQKENDSLKEQVRELSATAWIR